MPSLSNLPKLKEHSPKKKLAGIFSLEIYFSWKDRSLHVWEGNIWDLAFAFMMVSTSFLQQSKKDYVFRELSSKIRVTKCIKKF